MEYFRFFTPFLSIIVLFHVGILYISFVWFLRTIIHWHSNDIHYINHIWKCNMPGDMYLCMFKKHALIDIGTFLRLAYFCMKGWIVCSWVCLFLDIARGFSTITNYIGHLGFLTDCESFLVTLRVIFGGLTDLLVVSYSGGDAFEGSYWPVTAFLSPLPWQSYNVSAQNLFFDFWYLFIKISAYHESWKYIKKIKFWPS